MTSFPEGWFLVKNLNNGYVLSIEKSAVGEPVVIASVRNKDIESQLWQYGEDKRLHNKKTGYVLDIAKGAAKAGSNVVLQNDTNSTDGQTFGISPEGHIHIIKNPSLVLGIKDSFFTRREGQHVHLQLVDKKNFKERKEQRWELVTPSKRHSFVGSVLSGSVDSFKRTISNASLGSAISLIHDDDDDSHLDESAHLDQFPESEFLIKSELTGHFVSIDAASLNGSGSKVCLEPLRKDNYESQLWHYDAITHRLINKGSGLAMSAEDMADEAFVSQSASMTEQDLAAQAWAIGPSGSIRLKHKPQFLLGFKKDTWFSLGREAPTNVLVQKADARVHSYQKFILALPIFKKKTTEIVSATEQIGVFPEGYFFIKNQKHGLVISVLETDKLAAHVVAAPLDSQNYNRQLWMHKDGFLINKASQFVLDVRGGCITSGSQLCQYKQKTEGYENQQWGLSVEGYIHAKTHQTMVLALDKQVGDKPSVALAHKKTPDHEEQRWNFVLPVFKHKSTTVTEKSVQKSVIHHHYAQYPSGWFFIRSFVDSNTNEAPFVLTANSSNETVSLVKVSKDEWRYQLWMHWNGVLINFATQLAVDVSTLAAGATLRQELRQASATTQKWSLTTEGYLVHGSNVALALIPERQASGDYTLVLSEQAKPEHRWGLLTPQTQVENGLQVLQSWKTTLLTECKKVKGQYVQKVVHRIADWPEDTFYISAQDGLGLVPEKLESYATVVVRKLEFGHYEQFKWSFRDGYLVHVTTGLVLHASDDLVSGSELQIRERLVTDKETIDPRQRWIVKTDGSIVSETKSNLGFSLLKQGADYHVQLVYVSSQSEHYNWGFAHGRYETRYSSVYKKDMTVLTRLERILLTVRLSQVNSDKVKVVTRQLGVFPQNWFYVRSKADSSLVLTAPDKKEGSKLTLSKIDYKIFRRQLWHVEDSDSLVNLESGYVIDVAGGALEAGSDIIQWHKKFLKRQRKNQIWGLSVDGHIRPKAHPGLVLGAKGNRAEDGVQVQLQTRGALDLEYQRWSFAIPIFGRPNGPTSVGILEGSHSDIYVESVNENSSIETISSECCERTEKITIVRRWGLFPQGGFFIRSTYGDQHLALTVERKARTDGQGRTEYEVALRPIDFKEYKWSYWTFEDGHLIHPHTGLALDATPTKGVLLEDGLQSSLFVREKSMSLYQFWSLTASGEVHLKSDQRIVIGVSSANRITVSGAQVGLRQLHVRKSVNAKGQQEASLKSESWLQWTFSKPVFGTRKTTVVQEASAAIVSAVTADDSSEQEIESFSDETLEVQESEESSDEYSPEVDSEEDEESDSEDEEESPSKQDTSALDKLNLVGNLGIATAGATILAGAATTAKPASTKVTEAPVSQVSAGVTEAREKQEVVKTGGSIAKKTSQIKREESFHLSYSYVPSGYEKVVRYKPYQKSFFPVDGYFMIKSYLHGYVLDVANNEARDGSYIVLSPIKVTNFASQLWSFRAGRLVNLKGHNLVLDASLNDTVVAGERVGLSTQKTSVGISDQHWEFDYESGVIHLAGKRNLVLSVKELEPATEKTGRIDLFIQEEKSHQKSHFARAEQRWEVLLPALVPADQTKNKTVESKYTIVEGGKVAAISSSLSAVLAFEWLKATFHHKMAHDNQWPSTENFFFVRIGNENAYLCSGSSVNDNVTFAPLGQREDHKRFLWAYVNGYLVNYKYMLRLVFDKSTNKLTLSSNTDTLNQVFSITSQGVLSLKVDSETIYFTITTTSVGKTEFQLTTCSEAESTSTQYPVQLHIPVFSNHQVEKEANVALSTITTWIHTSQKVITTTTTTTRSYRYGVFPNSTWFFIIANTKSDESLVLAAKNNSNVEGANLVLKKLSFEDYKSQLWTFRDDTLVNYGSKLVIDVHEGAIENALIKLSSESGLGTQKWSLTAEGRIYLDSYSGYTLGIRQSDTLVEETELVLLQYDESKSAQAITWRFSVPVFGKKPVSSTASMTSAIESNSSSVEEGIMIETLKEVQFKVEEVFAKKPKYTNKPAAPTKSEVVKDKQEEHHDAHDILANVGIVSGAVAAGAAVIGVASKIMDKLDVEDCEKDTKVTTLPQKKDTKKPSKKEKANTETVIVRRSKRTSAQIVQESHAIVRAWKIVFIQRIHRCTTKAQLIETIEESREELFRRLDEHLRVYTSVEHMVSGSLPQWHVSIEQVKELYRARVFERFLDRLNHEEINSAAELDFDSVVSSATEEVNRHYESVIEEQKKIQTEVATDVQGVTETSNSEVDAHEHILLTVDTIKVKTRYWLIGLYETISIAKKNGSSEEEINSIVENSRKQLSAELSEIKASTVSHIEKSSSALSAKKSSIVNTVEKAISQTETVISKQVSAVGSEKHYEVNEEYWLEVTRTSEERLSSELKVYQTAITQEVSEVQTSQISKSDQAEISVVLDEKMVSVAQETVTTKLIETKTKLTSWFTEVTQQISWILESSTSNESMKQDTLDIVNAAQIELATRIEEAKLVLRTYYAHLTYLSWAERRRIEYSLDNIKTSLTANIAHFKQSIEKQEVTKEEITRFSEYSFGATVSRVISLDVETIVSKITKVKETTTVVNTVETKKAEDNKIAIISEKKQTEAAQVDTTKVNVSKSQESQKVNVDQKTDISKAQGSQKVNVDQKSQDKVKVDQKTEDKVKVDQTKVTKIEDKKQVTEDKTSSAGGKTALTAIGAAAAAMASAAIYHHHEGKETQEKKQDSGAVVEKPDVTHANVVVGKNTETLHDQKKTNTTTKQEKSETLVAVYNQVDITVQNWLTTLNKRMIECAQKKSDNVQEEIDTIVYESQQELVVAIEKAKRTTTSVIGTSQTSFHDTLAWIRSTIWTQTAEVKRVAYEVASSSETDITVLEEKLASIKDTTLSKVTTAIEKSKSSASAIHLVGHESAATIAAGKKFEGADYSKTSHGEYVEKTKVSVGILIEETRSTIQRTLNELAISISERRKQGGENVQADVEAIMKKSREEITGYIQRSKTEFEKRITRTHQVTESSNKVEIELVNETNKKVQATLEQIQESVLVQVSKVEEVTITTTSTQVTDVEYSNKLSSACHEAYERIDASLSVSEVIIGHHVEVVAESVEHATTTTTEENKETKKVSLGVEYGLLVVAETTKSVSTQITQLIERIHHQVTSNKDTAEQDVKTFVTESNVEIDRVFDEAKTKIEYELSMVASHEKVEEEHFLAVIEDLRESAKKRVSQVHEVAITEKEETKVVSERLLQIAEESRHEISSHFKSFKESVVEKTEKVKESAHQGISVTRPSTAPTTVTHAEQEKDHESKVDLAKKVLAGSAAVAAGTAIAVEVAKKVSAHKEKVEQEEKVKQQTVEVVEDIKVQFNKWISTLTETVITQSKQSQASQEEISITIEKSKNEFLEVIQKTKTSTVITEQHQQEILSWVEQTVTSQATRIQEIVVSSSTSTVVDIESRLEVLKISTTQEVEKALEKVKDVKSSTIKFVGSTVEQLKQKESALLDVKSELSLVVHDVRASVVTFFKKFTSSVISRVQQGGDNVSKDVAILVADTRKEVTSYIENVKNTATKKLSALETKSTVSVISVAALSGIATAELISVLKKTEEILVERINNVHSTVWYVKKDQDMTEIVQKITTIETETTTEISEKIDHSHYGFVAGIAEHHQAGHIATTEVEHHDEDHLKASLTIQEVKVTIREWLRAVAEKVSICSQNGQSSEEIESVVTQETTRIFEYIDSTVIKISGHLKSEEKIQGLHSTIEKVKSTITKGTTEIKKIGVEFSGKSTGYGGFGQMSSVINEHERLISETLVIYESKTTVQKTQKQQEIKRKESQNENKRKGSQSEIKKKVETKTVVTVEYITTTIHTWLEELMVEVSEVAKREHDVAKVTNQINSIINEAKEFITIELDTVSKKVRQSKGDSAAIQELVNIIEWTRGMVLQSTTQIQQIGVNSAVSFSSTGGIDQMRPLISATETQIKVAIERCSKTIKINVECKPAYHEKYQVEKDCRKQEREKSDCDKKAKAEKKKAECEKKDKKKKAACAKKEKKKAECAKKEKKKLCDSKKETKAEESESESESESDSSSSDNDDSDSDNDRKKKAKKEIKKIVASGAVLSVSVIVREWYEQLIVDVSTRAKRGGSHVDSDIETIVKKATLTIVEKLRILSENAHNNLVDVSTVQQYRNSIEWAKNLVIQSSLQIQTIGVNSAISATSKTGGIEQMRPIIVSIQQQIDVETRRYKLISEKEKSAVQKVESKPVSSVEHKKNTEKVSNGKASVVARKEYCGKLETHISEVISESKVVVIAWYSQLIRDVSIRVHQGGNNVKKDVATIIEQSKSQLDETLKRTQKKFTSSIDVYEEDETFSVIESQIQETLQVVQKTAEKKVTQVQEITVKYQSESEVTERLSTILESSKVEVTEALDTTHKQAISVIKEETVQNESAVTIIETVEHVKSVVASWQTKLSEEIHAISIDETVHDKEEKINALVHEANTEIERVSQEAKTKISESCKSVKKISKSKQTELLTTIDYVHETFSTDVKKVQEVSVEAVKKSETNVKESISSVFESSRSKVDSFLTRTAAVVVGTAAGAVAVHAIDKKKHEKDKVEKKTGSKSEGQFSLTVRENVKAISLWFELFTQRISSSVRKQEGNVVEHITSVSKHAEQEISEIIAAARTDFVKRLSHENMDKEAYDYAVKHYEESLESAHMSILTEVTEVKKVAIEAHKAGKIEVLDIELNKLVKESTERITIAMGSSVSITHKAQSGKNSSASEGSVLHIEVEDDKEVVGEQNVEFERKEESVNVSHEEKAKKEKHDSNLEKVVAGSLAVGATAGAAVSIHEKNKKDQKKSEKQTVEKYESGVAAIENVQVTISEWFKTLVQKVSHASKSGASSEQIIVIVQESRTELTQLIDHVKAAGAAHCTSASDEQQFVSKIEWVSSVAQAQAVQIQQIGINASVSKSDLTSQMESLATASFHQIEVTLEQMKTSINFHQKINKISGKKSVKKAEQAAKQKVTTAVDKTKAAYGVVQETRVATVALLVSLSESIVTRIRHGGVSVEEDVHKIVETAEKEVTKIFEKSKRSSTEIDEKTRLQVENALTTVHKTVEEQITQIKTVTVQSVNSSASDSESVIGKVLEISKSSTQKVETEFTSVSETITTSLTVVSQTAQKTTESVQSWFSELNEKIMKLMDAGDCTAEEVQKNVDKAIAEAQVEMNTNITKIQKESTASENKSGEISSDHHLDVFFGNIKSSMEKQLNEVKTTVKGKSKIDKIILEEVLKTSQAKLKAEIDSHNDAVKQVTSVDHITGTQQQVDSQIENNRHDLYKDTIEKVAVGTAAVAAAAAAAIGFHKKSQKSEATSVEVINESSIQTVHVKVDTWFSTLTERVISRTKQGGQNVSADISEIVKSAQNELEVIINELKTEHKNETYVASDSRRTFSCTLEWIKTTAITQSTQIIEIVNHSSSSSIDLATQIENHISVTKQQIDGAFEVHKKTESSVTVKSSEEVKLTKEDADASTSVDVVSKDQKHENVVQIVTETREQTQKRISLETTVIVQERKTEITNWLVLLMESLTTIIHSHSDSIRRDIFTRLELAEKEIETYVQDTKQRFLSITSSSANSKVDAETQKLAVNSIKQSLDCIENIKATLIIQISVIREIITRIEVEDITVITERLHAVIDRAQQRVHHTLDSGIELAITSAFEGKVVTWTETATIPQSFKNVRVIAYDLAGSVVDYRKSLYKVWKRIITPKNDIVLSTMDFNAFVRDWFGAYTEVKQENYRNRRVVSDDVCLHEALVHILKRFYVKDSFNEAEIEELCDNWRKVGTYDDASIGIRRIKSQTAAKYATIAISDSFSTRTMIELAQSNCLCWHAQFSYDMFAAEASTASESLVKGTIGLLGLAHANELAIVSTNHQLISAAKKNGCHAVLIEREEQVQQQVEYDVKVDGLDVFGESVQSFLEHESMVQVWNDKDVPSTPTVWAQKIKGVFN